MGGWFHKFPPTAGPSIMVYLWPILLSNKIAKKSKAKFNWEAAYLCMGYGMDLLGIIQ